MNCIQELKFKIEDNFLFFLRNSEIHEIFKYRPELYNLIESSIFFSNENKTAAVLMILTYIGYNKTDDLDSELIFHISSILELITLLSVIESESNSITEKQNGAPHIRPFSKQELITATGMISSVILNELIKLKIEKKYTHQITSIFAEAKLKFYTAKLKQSLLKNKIPGITLNNLFEIYDMKSMQIFQLPMQLPAIISNTISDFDFLKESALYFGRAFQIVKEINSFSPEKVLNYNIISALLWKQAQPNEKKELRKLFASIKDIKNSDEVNSIILKIKEYDILEKAAEHAQDLKETGISALIKTKLKDNVQDDIANFMDSLIVVKQPQM